MDRRKRSSTVIARTMRAGAQSQVPTLGRHRRPVPAAGPQLLRAAGRAEGPGQADRRPRTQVAGRLAAAVLGHLNTVVRLLAGAVEKAGALHETGRAAGVADGSA